MMTALRAASGERGSGSILVLAIVGAALVLAGLVLAACGVVVASARLDAAADAAALAAADAAAGWVAGEPCDRAAAVAVANGATLASCSLDGLEVSVALHDARGLPVVAASLAGPRRAERRPTPVANAHGGAPRRV